MHKFPTCNILDIDLTKQEINKKTLDSETYKMYPGGSVLGLYLIMQDIKPNIDPLSEDNILVFSVSPITGYPIGGLSRMVVTTKSPLTNTIGDSQAGGYFPVYLKNNGYDAIVLRGKSNKPVYLYIDEDNIQIKDGSHIWGKVTGESEDLIKEELNEDKIEIAQIGPGGENLVKYASIINMCNRANGRNGTGAVMGSKNLKAVVIKKKSGKKPINPEKLKELTIDVKNRIADNPVMVDLSEHGTDAGLGDISKEGFLPTRNWNKGYFKEGENTISGPIMTKTILKGRDTCYACPVRCKRVVEIEGVVDSRYGGPEYETCAAFGSYCEIDDLETIAMANQLCNMYGLDTISCGATIAFAMECYENKLITKEDTGGLELNFGNKDVIPKLIHLIGKREGFGNLLAQGSNVMSNTIGGKSKEFNICVKGQELPAHMPQNKPSVGLIYAVNSFGADHQSSEHDTSLLIPSDCTMADRIREVTKFKQYEDSYSLDNTKIEYAFNTQCFYSMLDSLCLCQFIWGPAWQLYGPDELIQLCRATIGWDVDIEELLLIGKRRINMMRYFNKREGFTQKDDILPKRIFKSFEDGPSKGIHLDEESFNNAKKEYYKIAGWDEDTGNPSDEILEELSLGWMVK